MGDILQHALTVAPVFSLLDRVRSPRRVAPRNYPSHRLFVDRVIASAGWVLTEPKHALVLASVRLPEAGGSTSLGDLTVRSATV